MASCMRAASPAKVGVAPLQLPTPCTASRSPVCTMRSVPQQAGARWQTRGRRAKKDVHEHRDGKPPVRGKRRGKRRDYGRRRCGTGQRMCWRRQRAAVAAECRLQPAGGGQFNVCGRRQHTHVLTSAIQGEGGGHDRTSGGGGCMLHISQCREKALALRNSCSSTRCRGVRQSSQTKCKRGWPRLRGTLGHEVCHASPLCEGREFPSSYSPLAKAAAAACARECAPLVQRLQNSARMRPKPATLLLPPVPK
jgi:hypothetical protein